MNDDYKTWYDEAMCESNAAGFVGFSAAETIKALAARPTLTVWYGAMPESNGKSNWTCILHREGESVWEDGVTIERSEYTDRVRYEYDRLRYLLGELAERPDILAYDANLKVNVHDKI